MSTEPVRTGFDLDAAWRLHPQVAVRPEPFGALLYHFGTRKLSFLKDRTLLRIVSTLSVHDSGRAALHAAAADESAPYVKALAVLADSQMLVRS